MKYDKALLSEQYLLTQLRRRSRQPVGSVLLEQRNFYLHNGSEVVDAHLEMLFPVLLTYSKIVSIVPPG